MEKQIISHLSVSPKGILPQDGFAVKYVKSSLNMANIPHSGFANIKITYSAPCGSDGGPHGYYWGGRFHKDLFEEKQKLEENLALLQTHGIGGDKKTLLKILQIPNHEGSGVIVSVTPNSSDKPRKIAAFVPVFSKDKKSITGLKYDVLEIDFQKIKKGDRVVIDASLRCDNHWQISKNGFALECHRDIAGRHTRKRVPGHMELPGFSYHAPFGLPYPNHMLSPVPKTLNTWIAKDPKKRESLLVAMEPLSCCIEAFHPVFMSRERVDRIAILGDGPNAALLALTSTTAFPNATIVILGRTDKKLTAIHALNPGKIICLKEGKRDDQNGHELLRKVITRMKKFDILIPTFEVPTLRDYGDVVEKSGRVIVWAAGQVGQKDPFKGVGNEKKLHHSYGGKNKMEISALLLCDGLAQTSSKRLEALITYPYKRVSLNEAATHMQEWLNNKGKYAVEMDGRKTSAKLLFTH
ncbi:hypothetical protein HYW55_05905 [Candidatus Gottesmanbacteria bacterium]|nr:hypothetical protein [Candidatus Gottesmanbacteria bacterium]